MRVIQIMAILIYGWTIPLKKKLFKVLLAQFEDVHARGQKHTLAIVVF